MRTGITTVYSTDSVSFGSHIDTWENDDGTATYGYESVTLTNPTSAAGTAVGSGEGTLEVGDLVKVEHIPQAHRNHTHEVWAVGPVKTIWAAPRRQDDGDSDGNSKLDARDYDPDNIEEWPGVGVVCEVYAPRLGGDVPVSQCRQLDAPPEAYVDRYGDDRSEGMWARVPIRKSEKPFNNDHLPDPEEDDREPEYIWTDGAYDTYREMRAEMQALPADDPNADPDNPETDRPYQVRVESGHLAVELLDGRGEQRMRDVADEYDASIEQIDTTTNDTITETEKTTYHVTVEQA